MAKRRDVIIGVVIVGSLLVMFGFFTIVVIGMMSQGGDDGIASFGEKVGVVEVYGPIGHSNGREIVRLLDRWSENNSIKAIVLDINSSGGGAAISEEVYDAVVRAAEQKPVVATLAGVAASGGYYIACAADRIVANKGSLTGSIGVIFQYYTAEELMGKIGVETAIIKSGEFKDVGDYSHKITRKEELMLRSVVMDTYEQFVEVVAEGREMDKEEVYPLADGSLYTGLQAYNLGLVDTLGGLKEAVDLAGDLAGIGDDPKRVYPYRRERLDLFDQLLGSVLGRFAPIWSGESNQSRLLYLYQ